MPESLIQGSFASGELSPALNARTDLAKWHVGAALIRNFVVDYRGGVFNRPGTRFVGVARASNAPVRLIPFVFSTVQAYMLEFGDHYMRVIMNGGYVLENGIPIASSGNGQLIAPGHGFNSGDTVFIAGMSGSAKLNNRMFLVRNPSPDVMQLITTIQDQIPSADYNSGSGGLVSRVYALATPYAGADLAKLKFVQSADTMTLTHPNYPPYDLTRTGHSNWQFNKVSFDVTIQPPVPSSATASPNTAGTAHYSYVITSVDAEGNESVASSRVTASNVINMSAVAGSVTVVWSPANFAEYYKVYKAEPVIGADAPAGAAFGFIGSTAGITLVDTNILPDFINVPPLHINPFANSSIKSVTILANGTGATPGAAVTVTDATGSGAKIEAVIDGTGQCLLLIVKDGGHDYTAPTIAVAGLTGGSFTAVLGPASGNYPATTGYYQQRKVYASTTNEPERFWMSQTGGFKNFGGSNPVRDSDAISAVLASQQVNDIKSMLSMTSGLIMLTGGGAWQVSGGSNTSAVTPKTITAQPHSYNGISDLAPIVIDYDILYVQKMSSVVRDLSYNFFANVYTGEDITALSNHLFYGFTMVSWAYAEEPYKIVWMVRNDGHALTLTYLKDQKVQAWSQHDTLGQFVDVASVPGTYQNDVYFVVRRFVHGAPVLFIEQLTSRISYYGVEDSWFVDSGVGTTLNYIYDSFVTASNTTGTIIVSRSPALFTTADVGKHLRMNGGMGVVKSFINPGQVEVQMISPMTSTVPNDPNNTPLNAFAFEWSLTTPVKLLVGLEHLEGLEVSILGDGSVYPKQTVVNGRVTLPRAASKIAIGLPFQAQLKTLKVDAEQGGTIQGKRVKIGAVTIRVDKTRGLKAGPDFEHLIELKERSREAYGTPIPYKSGDERVVLQPSWDKNGVVCVQQDYPLPASVLGLIPEIVVGDK